MFQFSVPKCMAVGAIPKLLMLKQDMEPLQSTGRPFLCGKGCAPPGNVDKNSRSGVGHPSSRDGFQVEVRKKGLNRCGSQ